MSNLNNNIIAKICQALLRIFYNNFYLLARGGGKINNQLPYPAIIKTEESGGKMTTARLIIAIVSTLAVEAALFTIWRWVLPEWGIEIPLAVLISVMVAYAIFAIVDFWFVTLILRRQTVVGLPTMIGSKGKVVSPLAPEGQVIIKGELWGAESIGRNIDSGEEVTVVGQDGLKLIVRKADSDLKGTE